MPQSANNAMKYIGNRIPDTVKNRAIKNKSTAGDKILSNDFQLINVLYNLQIYILAPIRQNAQAIEMATPAPNIPNLPIKYTLHSKPIIAPQE